MNLKKTGWLIFSSIAVLLISVGVTYAWFARNAAMTTLFSVQKPDTITITNIDGSEMTEIHLDYIDGTDTKAEDGTITIKRPICIKSSSPIHQIEIVHTTNLESLTFSIYPASTVASNLVADETKLNGAYQNEDTSDTKTTKTAKKEILENYKSTSDVADVHAYALYWIAQKSSSIAQIEGENGCRKVTSYQKSEFDVAQKVMATFYYTNYILEISWKESTKETDLFYIMAQSAN